DASRYCHDDLHPENTDARTRWNSYKGWLRANEDGTHSYMKWGVIYDHPSYKRLESYGIKHDLSILDKLRGKHFSEVNESFIQDKVHHNASIATMKAVASANEHKLARFVIDNKGKYHVGDASRYCHSDLHHECLPYNGWLRANEDGTHSYMKWCIHKDYEKHPSYKRLESYGIKHDPSIHEKLRGKHFGDTVETDELDESLQSFKEFINESTRSINESLDNTKPIYQASINQLKGMAKNSEASLARFVIDPKDNLHIGDALHHNHDSLFYSSQINDSQYGMVKHLGNDNFEYKLGDFRWDNHDHPIVKKMRETYHIQRGKGGYNSYYDDLPS